MFSGDKFIFNGVSCDEYNLMLYNIEGDTQGATTFAFDKEYVEDRVGRRYDPLFYGTQFGKPISFTMTFGLLPRFVNAGSYFTNQELCEIADWLISPDGYRYLDILDNDRKYVRYKCKITDLHVVDVSVRPQAMTCLVTCDSSFGYLIPETESFSVSGSATRTIYNKSEMVKYKPKITIELPDSRLSGVNFSIKNVTNNNSELLFSDIPTAVHRIVVDCENETITCAEFSNLYQYCNLNFTEFVRGENELLITGNGVVSISCEFPVISGTSASSRYEYAASIKIYGPTGMHITVKDLDGNVFGTARIGLDGEAYTIIPLHNPGSYTIIGELGRIKDVQTVGVASGSVAVVHMRDYEIYGVKWTVGESPNS